MRKIMLLATLLALAALMMAASPAMAQVDLDSDFGILNEDDDLDDCVIIDDTLFCEDDDDEDFFGFDVADGFAENEAESGAVDLSFDVSNTGDYASQCVPALQFGNTGNFNNAPTFGQFGSGGFVVEEEDDDGLIGDIFDFGDDENDDFVIRGGDASIDDFEPGGIEFSVSPELTVDCSHTVQQSSAASSTYYWPPSGHPAYWWY